jgi:hypothetical protein
MNQISTDSGFHQALFAINTKFTISEAISVPPPQTSTHTPSNGLGGTGNLPVLFGNLPNISPIRPLRLIQAIA